MDTLDYKFSLPFDRNHLPGFISLVKITNALQNKIFILREHLSKQKFIFQTNRNFYQIDKTIVL